VDLLVPLHKREQRRSGGNSRSDSRESDLIDLAENADREIVGSDAHRMLP